jgi:hypothetical protein
VVGWRCGRCWPGKISIISSRGAGWSTNQLVPCHAQNLGIPRSWYDKSTGRLFVANRPADAAAIEARLSDGRGLLADGGVSVSNIFTGDAPTALMTMSRVRGRGGLGPGGAYIRFFASPFVFVRALVLTIGEMVKELYQGRQQRLRGIEPRRLPRRARGMAEPGRARPSRGLAAGPRPARRQRRGRSAVVRGRGRAPPARPLAGALRSARAVRADDRSRTRRRTASPDRRRVDARGEPLRGDGAREGGIGAAGRPGSSNRVITHCVRPHGAWLGSASTSLLRQPSEKVFHLLRLRAPEAHAPAAPAVTQDQDLDDLGSVGSSAQQHPAQHRCEHPIDQRDANMIHAGRPRGSVGGRAPRARRG